MPEPPDVDTVREMPIVDLWPLGPIAGQRAQERVKIGNTVIVDGDQWVVTGVRVSTAIIERQYCRRCIRSRWVCEAHPDRPWPHDDCPGPGVPCPVCNTSEPPARPPGWTSLV